MVFGDGLIGDGVNFSIFHFFNYSRNALPINWFNAPVDIPAIVELIIAILGDRLCVFGLAGFVGGGSSHCVTGTAFGSPLGEEQW